MGNKAQTLALAVGELGERIRATPTADEARNDRRIDHRLTAGDAAERVDEDRDVEDTLLEQVGPPARGAWLDRRAAEQARRGRPREPSAQARKRLAFLCELLQLDETGLHDLRYQLLHRTAGAILEAQRFATHH